MCISSTSFFPCLWNTLQTTEILQNIVENHLSRRTQIPFGPLCFACSLFLLIFLPFVFFLLPSPGSVSFPSPIPTFFHTYLYLSFPFSSIVKMVENLFKSGGECLHPLPCQECSLCSEYIFSTLRGEISNICWALWLKQPRSHLLVLEGC